jgi:hypothetical protein
MDSLKNEIHLNKSGKWYSIYWRLEVPTAETIKAADLHIAEINQQQVVRK